MGDIDVDSVEKNLVLRTQLKEEYDQNFSDYLDEEGRAFPLQQISDTHRVALPVRS